jgi:hypothetical protein
MEGRQSNKPGQGRRRSRPDTPLIHYRRRRPTEAAIAADGASSMLDAVQGRDTLVSGTISKGRFVQGAQHPRIFGQGHISRGHINPAMSERKLSSDHRLNMELVLQILFGLHETHIPHPPAFGLIYEGAIGQPR